MSEIDLLHQFDSEVELDYKGEAYLVRDNGAVYRKRKSGHRKRPLDEKWTFGRQNKQSGYLQLGTHVAHRIVAFAFKGKPPSDNHVVDHIDTNQCNNRADNLRWVTRLENVILNPITLKRIIYRYGSLDNFFENPGSVTKLDKNIAWMRTVSKEEADTCRKRLLKWAESDAIPQGGQLGEWVYGKRQQDVRDSDYIQDVHSLSFMAIQRRWRTPTEFPCCPNSIGQDPLTEYAGNLKNGAVFSRDSYKETTVIMAKQGDGLLSVLLESREKDPVKPWLVSKVTIENEKFVHESLGSFFELNGAKKVYFKLLNIPFEGESIDDYC